ncbi:hypothetical protein K490DRAFT_42875 [Saccharata proteae CBS 121410]|uniref:Uncharacterized protein n=1 Tax=Saccharata proteae CBS 121410 TaxID=1314787 RepID=A0A9P4HV65_9PEZI|nr:hypothetical protein K490DRAFT_42875 [Saccharata proteae CBS 121410]
MTGLTGDPTQCPGCLDWLAYLYITIAVIYTILIGIGLVLLTCHRDRLAVRMRSFALTVAAVLVIHSYLFLIFVVYAIRWWYPCIDEYWVMALVFPLGLALYNVTSINYLQRRHRLTGNCVWWKSPIFILVQYIKQWYGELGFLGQTYLSIIGLMGIQAIVSIVVFFGSYNFHESYGFFGKWTGASNCFRGSNGEWIPTILWQFGWTWFFGPYCLYRTRMIQDTHYWAFQTRISVLAGLPGTPLWLLFLYSDNPTIARINAVFPHAGWLIPGLVAMQMSLILCPLLDYWKGAKWDRIAEAVEKRNKEAAVGTRSTTTLGSNDTTRTEAKSRANKISVLEHTLDSDASDALLMFAGNVQMSAENVLFCRSVLHLRKKAAMVATCTNGFALRGLYEDAIALFYTLVNPETSRLPINIDAKMYDEIAEWFRGATYEYMPCGLTIPAPEDRIAPWISSTCQYPDMKNLQTVDRAFERMANLRAIQINDTPRDPAAKAQPVPAGFSIDAVYDKAYLHIRTLIFHNTWSAFLDTQPAGDLEEMGEKSLSRETSITTAPPSYDWTSEEARAQAQQAFESARLARSDPAPDYSERNPAANEFASRTVDFDESELPPAATRQHIQNRDAISAARARVARASALDGADDCVDLVEKV